MIQEQISRPIVPLVMFYVCQMGVFRSAKCSTKPVIKRATTAYATLGLGTSYYRASNRSPMYAGWKRARSDWNSGQNLVSRLRHRTIPKRRLLSLQNDNSGFHGPQIANRLIRFPSMRLYESEA